MTDPDPMLAALRAADEDLRTACHAAFNLRPTTPSQVYDRTGALYALLSKVEQLAGHLAADAYQLKHIPGLYSDDGANPGAHTDSAGTYLKAAENSAREASRSVNDAWFHISPIGTRLPDEENP